MRFGIVHLIGKNFQLPNNVTCPPMACDGSDSLTLGNNTLPVVAVRRPVRRPIIFCSGAGEKLPLPSTASSPVPSISSGGDSWIDSFYPTQGEASSAGVGPQAQPSPPLSPVHTPGVSQATRWDLLDIESSAATHPAPEQASAPAAAELETPQEGPGGIDDLQVPRLNEPLISDEDRRIQLQQKLNLYKIGKNEIRDLAELSSRLEKAVLIEKKIEAALVSDGYDPDQIIYRIKDAKYSFYTQGGRCFCEPWMII
ncbi:hypothetical protein Pint_34153 [Pistacia integerrima]|uniref:Uncharacterized protein n=1 Tax=Pistacia integerrima TaxID=434235 RepID=A0ACC0X607_9ROSI|nr:hypothetical protein Pint_34153 [Pistacia integerrima]